mmetsp:Transcript_68785/g.199566  ORF Transcript_68785/g.199566 Transcript_68785/m.199566 type:complete len:217 (-) Transcript_68785:57-707(-)
MLVLSRQRLSRARIWMLRLGRGAHGSACRRTRMCTRPPPGAGREERFLQESPPRGACWTWRGWTPTAPALSRTPWNRRSRRKRRSLRSRRRARSSGLCASFIRRKRSMVGERPASASSTTAASYGNERRPRATRAWRTARSMRRWSSGARALCRRCGLAPPMARHTRARPQACGRTSRSPGSWPEVRRAPDEFALPAAVARAFSTSWPETQRAAGW